MALEYGILQSERAEDLETQVSRLIAEGWEPIGGVAVSGHPVECSQRGDTWHETHFTFAQAMIRRKDEHATCPAPPR